MSKRKLVTPNASEAVIQSLRTDLEEIASKAVINIKISSEEDLEAARKAIETYSNHEVYFRLDESPNYYHGVLKRIIGSPTQAFSAQLTGSKATSGFKYEKLRELIIPD